MSACVLDASFVFPWLFGDWYLEIANGLLIYGMPRLPPVSSCSGTRLDELHPKPVS